MTRVAEAVCPRQIYDSAVSVSAPQTPSRAITRHQSPVIDFILTEMKVIGSDTLLDPEIDALRNISCGV